jgi:hypothetical protein
LCSSSRREVSTSSLARHTGLHSAQEASMSVSWNKDVDSAIAAAAQQNKPLLLDFSAAPM